MLPLGIIGLDPGTTSAYAIIDVHGNLLACSSGKNTSLADTIAGVMNTCSPVIVGTDKARVPSFVEEFARKTGAAVVSPSEDLSRNEKRELLSRMSVDSVADDAHQQDSIAAALFAWKQHLPKIQKMQFFLREHDLLHKEREFMRLALKEDLSFLVIKDILARKVPENRIVEAVITDNRITKRDFLSLFERCTALSEQKKRSEQQLEEARQEVVSWEKKAAAHDRKKMKFQEKLDQLLAFKETRLRQQSRELNQKKETIRQLQQELEQLHKFIAHVPEFQLLKKVQTLSQKEFTERNKLLQIREFDFLLVEQPYIYSEAVLSFLEQKNITLLSPRPCGKVLRSRFPCAVLEPTHIAHHQDHFALADKSILSTLLQSENIVEQVVKEYQGGCR